VHAILARLLAAIFLRPRQSLCLLILVMLLALGSYGGWRLARARYLEPAGHWSAAQHALGRRDFAQALSQLGLCVQAWAPDAATQFLLARTARRA